MKPLVISLILCLLSSCAPLKTTDTTQFSTADIQNMAQEFESELSGNILPYWLKHAPNPATGGFYGRVDADGSRYKDEPRGALLSSRILWAYSAASIVYKSAEYRAMADQAFNDLEKNFWDQDYGGLYWSITAIGKPLETHKQIYGQVFGIYGYSEYYRATGNSLALERAKTLFALMEKHAFDPQHGGYTEAFAQDWSPLLKLSHTIGAPTVKSQNTHLHVMEAYTNLLRIWPDELMKRKQRDVIEVMLNKILDPATNHLALFMNADWKIQGDGISYGHDIEAAWLLVEAAEASGDAKLIKRTRDLAVKIADTTLAEGVDNDGGLFNEASATKGLTNSGKDWWAQAEALVGFINAYEITGDSKYLVATERTWGFIKTRLVNHKGGEWHWGTDRAGTVIVQPTLSMWKCPYHNSRAMMEATRRLHRLASMKTGH